MQEQFESENKKQKNKRIKQRKNNRKTGFYYSFFTVVLVFCLIQIGYGAILNVGKIISYQGKMYTLENLLKKTQARNEDLKTEKKVITSDNSLEGIARNNLKMASEDEVLIIINKKVEEPKKEPKKWKFTWFGKKEKPKEEQPIGEIYIPQEADFAKYDIEDFISDMLPYASISTTLERKVCILKVRGKMRKDQYFKLIKFIIDEEGFIVIKSPEYVN